MKRTAWRIADPADWPLVISAEQKTNPRIMAPFTHVSTDRPSRFTDGSYGVFYLGDRLETALFETIHHYACFRALFDQSR